MTTVSEVALPALSFRLPGSWARVPLDNLELSAQAIRAYAMEVGGREDRLAQARADLRRSLERAANDAREAGARVLYSAIEPIPAVPLSIAFTEHWPDIDLESADSTSGADVVSALLVGFAAAGESVAEFERYTSGHSEVLRRHSISRVITEGEPDAPEYRSLSVQFWLTVPGQRRVVLLSFVTPHGDFADELLGLFGAIVASAVWPEQPLTPGELLPES